MSEKGNGVPKPYNPPEFMGESFYLKCSACGGGGE